MIVEPRLIECRFDPVSDRLFVLGLRCLRYGDLAHELLLGTTDRFPCPTPPLIFLGSSKGGRPVTKIDLRNAPGSTDATVIVCPVPASLPCHRRHLPMRFEVTRPLGIAGSPVLQLAWPPLPDDSVVYYSVGRQPVM